MNNHLLYTIGCFDSCRYASFLLGKNGFALTDHPSPEVSHLLLDVPSFDASGALRDGTDLKELLRMLPKSISIIGGNLHQSYLQDYRKIDLLQDPYYLSRNAAITAECALQVTAPYLKTTFAESPVLILGWGRIGKCLSKLLADIGCPVTVAARNSRDRAMLEALGYKSADFPKVPEILNRYKVLLNTVPDLPLHIHDESIIAIDLASYPGMRGDHVIQARGLPGKYAPESSGKLIADTIQRMIQEGTL